MGLSVVLPVIVGRERVVAVVGFEIIVALGFGLGLDFGGDAVVQHFDHVEQSQEVVGEAGAGDDGGDEVDGKDEIAQHTYDEAFVPERDGSIGEHIVKQQDIVDYFTPCLGGGGFDFVP